MTRGAIRSAGIAVACGLALGACASMNPKPPHLDVPGPALAPPPKPTPAPVPPPVVVRVPVPVKEACVPKSFPRAPKYPDSDAALRDAGGAADRYQLMAAGRLLRDRRLGELEKLVDGCR
jgi:hypothetical protein